VSPLQDILLGILQGLGEFLPISSSAHLILVPWLLGWPEHSLAFDVALHVGTLVAVLVFFAADWIRLFRGAIEGALRGNPFANPEGRLLGLLVLATIPGGIAGLLLEKWADTALRAPVLVATALAAMGLLLLVADRAATGGSPLSSMSVSDALLIGISQAFAVIPGVSRSGITISAALFLRYPREEAARFSFLLSTPIILGAAAVKVPHLLRSGDPSGVLLGVVASAVVGLLAIGFLLSYVRTRTYVPFAVYRFLLAALVLAVAFIRSRHLG
jgi:undecaprenyl-diphosphatase